MSHVQSRDIPGPTDLKVTQFVDASGTCVLRVVGTLDAASVTDFSARLQPALNPVPVNLLMDFGGVDYVSSLGLSAVLQTAIRLKNAGSACRLYDPQLSVRRVFEIAKWHHLILDPAAVEPNSPFFSYLCDEEPKRAPLRNKATANPPRLYPE